VGASLDTNAHCSPRLPCTSARSLLLGESTLKRKAREGRRGEVPKPDPDRLIPR